MQTATPQYFCQNGWPASPARLPSWVRFSAGGRAWDAPTADVAAVAKYAIDYFDVHVESITDLDSVFDDWSYSFRPIRGQTHGYSNHAGACAWDLNATRHPRGVHNTFTADQIRTFDRLINTVLTDNSGRPVLRWGEHYVSAPVDGMHIEIIGTPAQVAQVVAKIRTIQQEEVDMQWGDKIPLTAADADIYNLTLPAGHPPYKEGTLVTVGSMVRYPTLARKIQAEMLDVQADLNTLQESAGTAATGIAHLGAQLAALQTTTAQILTLLKKSAKKTAGEPDGLENDETGE